MEDLFEKQRRAVRVVKTALDNAGVHDRDVCAGCGSETPADCAENFAVFVSAPLGADIEPYYETGKTMTEAVRKILATIKGHEKTNGAKTDDQSEVAPF
ncbi:MAG: hypothetical protein ACR65R_03160 [Methylomicrobium sp.]